jgi:hypothetical protein
MIRYENLVKLRLFQNFGFGTASYFINFLWKLVMTRKKIVWLAVMLILAGFALNAQEGYQGPGLATVQEANELEDSSSPIALYGKIEAFGDVFEPLPRAIINPNRLFL